VSELAGRVRREEFGPGAWILETPSGERYALAGDLSGLSEGQEVRVEGRVRDDLLGGAMTGAAVFEVERAIS